MDEVWHHPKVRLWELPGEPPEPPPGLAGPDAYRFVVEAPFRAYAAKHGKPRWGDKTPHYVHHVDAPARGLARARFVVLVRDGRDVALSLSGCRSGPTTPGRPRRGGRAGSAPAPQAQRRIPARCCIVRYEDLAADPTGRCRRICEFLELSLRPGDARPRPAPTASTSSPDQTSWFPTLFDGINTRSAGRWQSEMSVRDQRLFAAHARAELEATATPSPTARSALSERRATGTGATTSCCATSTSCGCGSSRSAAASCASPARRRLGRSALRRQRDAR